MPAITATTLTGPGRRTLTETTLNGTDSFVYAPGDILILRNPTGLTITPTIVGSTASAAYPAPGVGTVNLSAGFPVTGIATTVAIAIPLDSISAYLQGSITITSGTGLVAALLRPSA